MMNQVLSGVRVLDIQYAGGGADRFALAGQRRFFRAEPVFVQAASGQQGERTQQGGPA